MVPVEKRILIKVANMYYLENMKQSDIAKKLGVERTTISKYLKRAMEQGIVSISIKNDNYEDLESAMEKRFGLKEVFIVPKGYDIQAVKQNMARAGLNLLRRIVDNGQVIGIAWGTTIRELTRYAEQEKLPTLDADFVPLDGGPENINSEFHVNTLCYELARAFGARSHYIYAPAITRTVEIRQAIVQDVNYEKISAFWDKLDIGIVGIALVEKALKVSTKPVPLVRFVQYSLTLTVKKFIPTLVIESLQLILINFATSNIALEWRLHARRCRRLWVRSEDT